MRRFVGDKADRIRIPLLMILAEKDPAPVRADHHLLAGVVDGDDVRVVEGGRRLGLAAEAGLEDGVAREVGPQHLDRDDPREAGVEAEVDLGHASASDERSDFIPAG